jgi:hypothetical protein
VLLGLLGCVAAGAVWLLGRSLGQPELPLGLAAAGVLVVFAAQAVVQVARLTFTDTGLYRDAWVFGFRRRLFVSWSQIVSLNLEHQDEGSDRWSLTLGPLPSPSDHSARTVSVSLMMVGDTRQRCRSGWWRQRHFHSHARLLATFHRHGIALVDYASHRDFHPRPIDQATYPRFLWNHYDEEDPPPLFR